MNVSRQPLSPTARKQRTARRVRDLLFLTGVIALTYVGFTLMEARVYQASANEALGTQMQVAEKSSVTQSYVMINEGDVVGRMDIPRLGLSVAILQGTGSRILRLGAGHIEGTPLPGERGNSGVAGHRDTFFRGLKDIRKDDAIQMQTATGITHYEVDSMKVVGPDDTSVLQPEGEGSELTLVTCYPFYLVGPAPKRFIVHAHKS